VNSGAKSTCLMMLGTKWDGVVVRGLERHPCPGQVMDFNRPTSADPTRQSRDFR
jgi:hypothetical protein